MGNENMKRSLLVALASVLLLTIAAVSQESRSQISVQGTGFFTKDSNGDGVSRATTQTGGLQLEYRYRINRWFSAEGNYGFDRNTQRFFSSDGLSRVQSNVHAVTGDVVVKLPLHIRHIDTYALAGGGALIFDPTGNAGGSVARADNQSKGAFLYGVGADYALARQIHLPPQYRGFLYNDPNLPCPRFRTPSYPHTAPP